MIFFFTFMTPYLFTHRAEHNHDAAEHGQQCETNVQQFERDVGDPERGAEPTVFARFAQLAALLRGHEIVVVNLHRQFWMVSKVGALELVVQTGHKIHGKGIEQHVEHVVRRVDDGQVGDVDEQVEEKLLPDVEQHEHVVGRKDFGLAAARDDVVPLKETVDKVDDGDADHDEFAVDSGFLRTQHDVGLEFVHHESDKHGPLRDEDADGQRADRGKGAGAVGGGDLVAHGHEREHAKLGVVEDAFDLFLVGQLFFHGKDIGADAGDVGVHRVGHKFAYGVHVCGSRGMDNAPY